MTGRPGFDGFGGPAALIDRMIGEEYAIVKLVALAIPELQGVLAAIQSIEEFDQLMVTLAAARDAAAASASAAEADRIITLALRNATETFRAQTQGLAAGAAASAQAADQSKTAAAGSANASNNSAISAGSSQGAAAVSATLAQKWATQTNAEVVAGQGYGSKKYALDAAISALSALGSADAAEISRLGAVAAKNEAVAIAGFDVSLYATKDFAKKAAKRAAMIFGS